MFRCSEFVWRVMFCILWVIHLTRVHVGSSCHLVMYLWSRVVKKMVWNYTRLEKRRLNDRKVVSRGKDWNSMGRHIASADCYHGSFTLHPSDTHKRTRPMGDMIITYKISRGLFDRVNRDRLCQRWEIWARGHKRKLRTQTSQRDVIIILQL